MNCSFRCVAAVSNPKVLLRGFVCPYWFHIDDQGVDPPPVIVPHVNLSPSSSPARSPSRKKTTIVLSTPPRQSRSVHASPEKHIRFSVI